jgi:hypothetical protein
MSTASSANTASIGGVRELATQIRDAARYLTARRYSLEDLATLTTLHPNSLLMIRRMQVMPTNDNQSHWVWNPHIDTIEKLEAIVLEARRRGWRPVAMEAVNDDVCDLGKPLIARPGKKTAKKSAKKSAPKPARKPAGKAKAPPSAGKPRRTVTPAPEAAGGANPG